MAKKRITTTIREDTEKVIDVIKKSIERQDMPTIDSFSSFIDMLIKSFAYQILNDKETFVVQPAKVKEQLLNAGFTPKTFRDIATTEGYKEVENDNTIKNQEKQIKLYKEIIDNLKAEKQDLENDNTKLENEIKRKEKTNAESSVGVSSNDKTPVFSNQNQNAKPKNNKGIGRGKAPKPKYEPPIVDAVRLIYNGQVLGDITKDDYKAYIEKTNDEKMAQQKLKSHQYLSKDKQFQITQQVYIALRRIAEQYTDDKLQMKLNASEFEDEFKHEGNLASDKDKVIAEIELVEDKLNKKVQEFKRKKEKEIEEKLRKQQEQQQEQQQQQQQQDEPTYNDEPTYEDEQQQDEPTYYELYGKLSVDELVEKIEELEKTEEFKQAKEDDAPIMNGTKDVAFMFYDIEIVDEDDDFGDMVYTTKVRASIPTEIGGFDENEMINILKDEGVTLYENEEKREEINRIREAKGQSRIDENFLLEYFAENKSGDEDLSQLAQHFNEFYKDNAIPLIDVEI